MQPTQVPPVREEYHAINQLGPVVYEKVNVKMIVIETTAPYRLTNGDLIQIIKVGDPTACINLTIRQPDVIDVFQPGDILRLRNGYVSIHRGSLNIQANRSSEISRIGEFSLAYNEMLNMSDYNSELASMERQKKGSPPDGNSAEADPRKAGRAASLGKRPFQAGTPTLKKDKGGDPRARP